MEVSVTKDNGITICAITGDLDMYAAPDFHAQYSGLATKDGASHFIIDLEKNPYIDSSGIGVLFQIFSDTKVRGVRFCICGASGMVEKLFHLSRMAAIIPLEKTRADAIHRIRG
jgi:anti-anti-sigma factor